MVRSPRIKKANPLFYGKDWAHVTEKGPEQSSVKVKAPEEKLPPPLLPAIMKPQLQSTKQRPGVTLEIKKMVENRKQGLVEQSQGGALQPLFPALIEPQLGGPGVTLGCEVARQQQDSRKMVEERPVEPSQVVESSEVQERGGLSETFPQNQLGFEEEDFDIDFIMEATNTVKANWNNKFKPVGNIPSHEEPEDSHSEDENSVMFGVEIHKGESSIDIGDAQDRHGEDPDRNLTILGRGQKLSKRGNSRVLKPGKLRPKKAYGFYSGLLNTFSAGGDTSKLTEKANMPSINETVQNQTRREGHESNKRGSRSVWKPPMKTPPLMALRETNLNLPDLTREVAGKPVTAHCSRPNYQVQCDDIPVENDLARTEKQNVEVGKEDESESYSENDSDGDAEDNVETETEGSRVKKGRLAVCRAKCEGCLKPSCGVCGFCVNPYLKQRCKERICSTPKWTANPREPSVRRVKKKPVPKACQDCGKVIKYPGQNMKRHKLTCKGINKKGDEPSMLSFLTKLNLLELVETFEQEHITLDILQTLSHNDLKEIGIVAYGDRHRLLKDVTQYMSKKDDENLDNSMNLN